MELRLPVETVEVGADELAVLHTHAHVVDEVGHAPGGVDLIVGTTRSARFRLDYFDVVRQALFQDEDARQPRIWGSVCDVEISSRSSRSQFALLRGGGMLHLSSECGAGSIMVECSSSSSPVLSLRKSCQPGPLSPSPDLDVGACALPAPEALDESIAASIGRNQVSSPVRDCRATGKVQQTAQQTLETRYTKSFNINRLHNHAWRIWSPYGAPTKPLILLSFSASWRQPHSVWRNNPTVAAHITTFLATLRSNMFPCRARRACRIHPLLVPPPSRCERRSE